MEKDIDESYLEGFNDAYVLGPNQSHLLVFIVGKEVTNNYLLGLKHGVESYVNSLVFPDKKALPKIVEVENNKK
jgi:hypothetical protein